MRRFFIALQFLTIIPVRVNSRVPEDEIRGSAVFFPLAGAFQGLLIFTSLALVKIFPVYITSALVLLMLIIINGGFHMDGLADTFDALSVKSSGDKEADRQRRLSVMKDSQTGAIGVVAIVMTILIKYLFITQIFLSLEILTACFILFLMPSFSKWTMVAAMYHGEPARNDGLGRIFLERMTFSTVMLSSAVMLMIFLAAFGLRLSGVYGLNGLWLFVFPLISLYMFGFMSAAFFKKRFGGLTGDNFGAIGEVSEIIFLMTAGVWSRLYTS